MKSNGNIKVRVETSVSYQSFINVKNLLIHQKYLSTCLHHRTQIIL